ncbi:unannotated protein [freshwater metagenome]|uniref:Unannotated protein n=1 Tax=freshwater metagenome TaxID=449393 RepID=A0A6J7Q4S0_9ZZZZ
MPQDRVKVAPGHSALKVPIQCFYFYWLTGNEAVHQVLVFGFGDDGLNKVTPRQFNEVAMFTLALALCP